VIIKALDAPHQPEKEGRSYSHETRAEVLEFAHLSGVVAAAAEFGISRETIRRWKAQAGRGGRRKHRDPSWCSC